MCCLDCQVPHWARGSCCARSSTRLPFKLSQRYGLDVIGRQRIQCSIHVFDVALSSGNHGVEVVRQLCCLLQSWATVAGIDEALLSFAIRGNGCKH